MKTRFSRYIQVITMAGMHADFAGAKIGHGSMETLFTVLVFGIDRAKELKALLAKLQNRF